MTHEGNVQRVSSRTRTSIAGNVSCKTGSSNGIVRDLSEEGICFQLPFDIGAQTGQEVTIRSEELGFLTGIVRWTRGDRIGIKLTAAQIASYYKFFRYPAYSSRGVGDVCQALSELVR